MVAYVIALILLIPALVWGALGVGDTNQKGQLNGGCLVQATSSAPDQTRVTDSYKRDPFKIDPQGSLHWEAASPTIFMDYDWEMWVEIGGIAVPFDDGHELNDGGSPANMGDVGNVAAYAQSVGVNLDQLRGVFMVGGFAATCDGFGFVVLTTDGLTTPSIVAAILALLILIILIILMFRGRGGARVGSTAVANGGSGEPEPAADIAAGAIASGYATPEATEGPPPELSDDDVDDIQEALDETFPADTNQADDESPVGRHEDGGGA
jgi:uncharacterized membrane protein